MSSLPLLPPDAQPPLPPFDDGEFQVFVTSGPLYKTLSQQAAWKYEGHFYVSAPKRVQLYCDSPECQKEQQWDIWRELSKPLSSMGQVTRVGFGGRNCGFYRFSYSCRNCGRNSVTYFVLISFDGTQLRMVKVGQWPALTRNADPIVVAGWSEHDKILFRDALTFRNSNKGIGALPYLRRIIERHIQDVLELIAEAHQREPIHGFNQAEFDGLRTSHRFSDKLDFAKKYLPPGLVPEGSPNPIGLMYELISDGLHQRTEDECVHIFDRCKAAFEFVVRKLTEAKREDEAYTEAIRKLNASPE